MAESRENRIYENDDIICSICLNNCSSGQYIIFNCFHTFCKGCIEKISRNRHLKLFTCCPICCKNYTDDERYVTDSRNNYRKRMNTDINCKHLNEELIICTDCFYCIICKLCIGYHKNHKHIYYKDFLEEDRKFWINYEDTIDKLKRRCLHDSSYVYDQLKRQFTEEFFKIEKKLYGKCSKECNKLIEKINNEIIKLEETMSNRKKKFSSEIFQIYGINVLNKLKWELKNEFINVMDFPQELRSKIEEMLKNYVKERINKLLIKYNELIKKFNRLINDDHDLFIDCPMKDRRVYDLNFKVKKTIKKIKYIHHLIANEYSLNPDNNQHLLLSATKKNGKHAIIRLVNLKVSHERIIDDVAKKIICYKDMVLLFFNNLIRKLDDNSTPDLQITDIVDGNFGEYSPFFPENFFYITRNSINVMPRKSFSDIYLTGVNWEVEAYKHLSADYIGLIRLTGLLTAFAVVFYDKNLDGIFISSFYRSRVLTCWKILNGCQPISFCSLDDYGVIIAHNLKKKLLIYPNVLSGSCSEKIEYVIDFVPGPISTSKLHKEIYIVENNTNIIHIFNYETITRKITQNF